MSLSIRLDLNGFAKALENGEAVECNTYGQWFIESKFKHNVRWLFGKQEERVLKVSKAFIKELDILERTPVKYYVDPEAKEKQSNEFEDFIRAAEGVKKQLQNHHSITAKKQLNELNLKVTALKYRIGSIFELGGASDSLVQLKSLAEEWKRGYDLYEVKTISEVESEKLATVCKYSEFIDHLKLDKPLRDLFFKWLLRDNNDVDSFVQFPSIATRMKNSFVAARVGRFIDKTGFNYLEMQQNSSGIWEQHFVLPFELQEGDKLVRKTVSIMDEGKEVNLRGNYKVTIKKVIDVFADKNKKTGGFEFINGWICNWHGQKLGWWNPEKNHYETIDLSPEKMEWWKQLSTFETLTPDDINLRYGVQEDQLKDHKWVVVVKATRESASLDVDKAHGFLEVLIPDEKGTYTLYPFGKLPHKFPQNFLELVFFVTNTQTARIQFPDENVFFAQRQQAASPYLITPEQGAQLMDDIRADIKAAQEGNIVFQFAWENCAWWPQKKLEQLLGPEVTPDCFKNPLLDAQPKVQPLRKIIEVCNKLKGYMQRLAVRIVEFVLLSWRGLYVIENGKRVFKSVATSGHLNNFEIFHPGALHLRILLKKIWGVVTMGHLFVRQEVAVSA